MQTPLHIVRSHELRFAAIVKPDQQPFEIRGEVDKLQTLAAFDRLRVPPGGAVLRQSVEVEKHQSSLVAPHGIRTPPPAIDSEFDDGTGVPAAGDDNIEMNMKALFIAELLEPSRECALAIAFRRDEDTFALRNRRPSRHGSAERGQSAECAAAVQFSKIATPAHPMDIAHAVGTGCAGPVLFDDENLFLLEIVQGRQAVEGTD